jgi:hypothetical protein
MKYTFRSSKYIFENQTATTNMKYMFRSSEYIFENQTATTNMKYMFRSSEYIFKNQIVVQIWNICFAVRNIYLRIKQPPLT